MLNWVKYYRYIKYPQFFSRNFHSEGYCYSCGEKVNFKKAAVINSDLCKTWRLSKKVKELFDFRESMFCSKCQNTLRTRQLAKVLVKVYGEKKVNSLKQLVKLESFRKLCIAEINYCGNLHQFLKTLPKLYYSEYQGFKKYKKVRHEDIQKLSYPTEKFDLVLTSDTLEHIPDLNVALAEVYRVLKKRGYHIFTVPVIINRVTRKRYKNSVKSYHGSGEDDHLVYYEFGGDFLNLLNRFGFTTQIYFYNLLNDDCSYVFVCQKP